MILKKADINKEIFIYFCNKEEKEYKIKLCDEIDIDKLYEVFKEKLKDNRENESNNKGFYLFYFLYLKKTGEIIFVDSIYGKRLEIIKNLHSKIKYVKEKDLIRTDICLEAIIFFEEKVSEILINKLDKLRKKTLYYKNIESFDKLENLLSNLADKLKKFSFSKVIINIKFLTITIAVYLAFTSLYLSRIGLPLELIYSENLKIFVESLVFLIYTLIGILNFIFGFIPILFAILIVIMLGLSLYFIIVIVANLVKVIKNSYSIRKFHFYISKFLKPKDIILFNKLLSLILILPSLISLITITLIYIEPIVFAWKYAFPNSKFTLIDFIKNKFNIDIAKQEILRNIYISYPNLRFIEINNIGTLEIAEKDGKVYFYRLKDIKKILGNYINKENDKKINEFKKEFCENLHKLVNCCQYKYKDTYSSELIKSCSSVTKFEVFHTLFFLPTKYELYPYDIVLKEKIQSLPLKQVKFQNLNKCEILKILKSLCNQKKYKKKGK